jgi:hypothetical protein
VGSISPFFQNHAIVSVSSIVNWNTSKAGSSAAESGWSASNFETSSVSSQVSAFEVR